MALEGGRWRVGELLWLGVLAEPLGLLSELDYQTVLAAEVVLKDLVAEGG
jgi:hypothetical protein